MKILLIERHKPVASEVTTETWLELLSAEPTSKCVWEEKYVRNISA